MPRIPVLDDQSPTTGRPMRPGAGSAPLPNQVQEQESTKQLAGALQGFLAREKLNADRAAVNEYQAKLGSIRDNIMNKYTQLEGKNAIGSYKQAAAEFEGARKQLDNELLHNPIQRAAATQRANSYGNKLAQKIQLHEIKEGRKYFINATEAAIANEKQDMQMAGSFDDIEAASGNIAHRMQEMGERFGWSPEQLKANTRAALSESYRELVESKLADPLADPSEASAVLKQYRNRMDPDDLQAARKLLGTRQLEFDAENWAGKLDETNKDGTPKYTANQLIEEVKKLGLDENKEKFIIRVINEKRDLQQKQRAEAREDAIGQLEDQASEAGMTIHQYARRSPEGRRLLSMLPPKTQHNLKMQDPSYANAHQFQMSEQRRRMGLARDARNARHYNELDPVHSTIVDRLKAGDAVDYDTAYEASQAMKRAGHHELANEILSMQGENRKNIYRENKYDKRMSAEREKMIRGVIYGDDSVSSGNIRKQIDDVMSADWSKKAGVKKSTLEGKLSNILNTEAQAWVSAHSSDEKYSGPNGSQLMNDDLARHLDVVGQDQLKFWSTKHDGFLGSKYGYELTGPSATEFATSEEARIPMDELEDKGYTLGAGKAGAIRLTLWRLWNSRGDGFQQDLQAPPQELLERVMAAEDAGRYDALGVILRNNGLDPDDYGKYARRNFLQDEDEGDVDVLSQDDWVDLLIGDGAIKQAMARHDSEGMQDVPVFETIVQNQRSTPF